MSINKAFVFFVIFFSISFGSILKLLGSISAKIGLAPANIIELIVEAKVIGVVITSSLFSMPQYNNDKCNAAVHELTERAYLDFL